MPILASEDLLRENKKSSEKSYPSGNKTWASHNLWFQVQHYPFWTTSPCTLHPAVNFSNIIVQYYFGANCIGYLFMIQNIFSHRHQY